MRIYSSKGSDQDYFWRDRGISSWPVAEKNDIVCKAPDFADWISEDHRIIGATRVGSQVWFAWAAGSGDGGHGGFRFPSAHIQIAKFDVGGNFKCVEQTQIWNPDIAFCYPSLTTNSQGEVGVSLAWGGGTNFGSHAVGILGDFVVWFQEPSQMTSTFVDPSDKATKSRFGDYLHVRLAYPDTTYFSAFGYAVLKASDGSATRDSLYIEFGRPRGDSSGLH